MRSAWIFGLGVITVGILAPQTAEAQGGKLNNKRTYVVGDVIGDWDLGTGQPKDNFTTVEVNGIRLGLKAFTRFDATPLPLMPVDEYGDFDPEGEVGLYTAPTGFTLSNGKPTSLWGYQVYVNVANGAYKHGKRVYRNLTLNDFDIVVYQDYSFQGDWYGFPGLDATNYFNIVKNPTGTKFQSSWAPTFGVDDFDTEAEARYTITLKLIPRSFQGGPISVSIMVDTLAPTP